MASILTRVVQLQTVQNNRCRGVKDNKLTLSLGGLLLTWMEALAPLTETFYGTQKRHSHIHALSPQQTSLRSYVGVCASM